MREKSTKENKREREKKSDIGIHRRRRSWSGNLCKHSDFCDSHHIAPSQGLLFSYGIIWPGDLNAGKRALGFQFEARELKKKTYIYGEEKKEKRERQKKKRPHSPLTLLYRSTLISLAWLKFTGSN